MSKKPQIFALIAIVLSGLTLFSLFASAEEEIIPSWIKNTASFWVNGDVSDKEFISAIEWMLENNVLQVSYTEDGEWKAESDKLYKENQQLEEDIAALEARIAAFEQGIPPQTNPCDPDGDAAITAQELSDVLTDHGFTVPLSQVQIFVVKIIHRHLIKTEYLTLLQRLQNGIMIGLHLREYPFVYILKWNN